MDSQNTMTWQVLALAPEVSYNSAGMPLHGVGSGLKADPDRIDDKARSWKIVQ